MALITHGDFHMWNIAFHTCRPEKLKFFDFQVTRFANPLIDIQIYLGQVSRAEQRQENQTTYLRTYLTTFLDTAKELGCCTAEDVLNEASLLEEYKRTYLYGFLLALRWNPPRFSEDDDMFSKEVTTQNGSLLPGHTVEAQKNTFMDFCLLK